MNISIEQISSLDKIFKENTRERTAVSRTRVLRNERYSYQLAVTSDEGGIASVTVTSPIAEYVRIYRERAVYCDKPVLDGGENKLYDDNYLTFEPTMIPDVLEPLGADNGRIRLSPRGSVLWVRVDVPEKIIAGEYDITIKITADDKTAVTSTMTLDVCDATLPKSDLLYTQWFYCDCIAAYYNTEIYSDRHWELIESFITAAADSGINMLLSPVHNPPLDTAVGHERPNVQLVRMTRDGATYSFDFTRFERWVSLCKKHGITHFEIPHFFSQWGSTAAPNIYVDGTHTFGTHTPCDSDEYVDFLTQYIHALIGELKRLGIYENTYFHISDEPSCDNIDAYKRCYDIVTGIADDLRLIDALSDVEFYRKGLVKTPIPASNEIEPFLAEDIDERWVYYCCIQGKDVSNRFMAMSAFRNRIMGVQMYKFNIKGFLQWGFNFYFSQFSEYAINPYSTTSADYAFPSGDAFSVYPGRDGALPSMRSAVFYEGLQDYALCKLVESKTSREYVVNLIDTVAGKDVRFADMPDDEGYIYKLRERLIAEL